MENQTIIQRNVSEQSIRLNVGMKGHVGWEIKLSGDDTDKIIDDIWEVDNKLKEKFKDRIKFELEIEE